MTTLEIFLLITSLLLLATVVGYHIQLQRVLADWEDTLKEYRNFTKEWERISSDWERENRELQDALRYYEERNRLP